MLTIWKGEKPFNPNINNNVGIQNLYTYIIKNNQYLILIIFYLCIEISVGVRCIHVYYIIGIH